MSPEDNAEIPLLRYWESRGLDCGDIFFSRFLEVFVKSPMGNSFPGKLMKVGPWKLRCVKWIQPPSHRLIVSRKHDTVD